MDCRPIVTYAGDRAVFSGIESGLVSGLPTEAVEWKRSYGRNSRSVYVEVDFVSFNAERAVVGSGDLQGQPVFHTFWTSVTDVDTYHRQGVKEEILAWQSTLKKVGSTSDWLVVVVELPDSKKGVNKFPLRTTVLDRLKQDVGGKTPDRVVSLMDPAKSDSRAAESMQALLHKFRLFFLQSFNKVLNKFEENIRAQREKRTDASWNFCQYFLLQEQLAFVYETMGLFDESLIQYDELDALFTQFVLNCNVEESPTWLAEFNQEVVDWSGVSLERAINQRLSIKLESRNPSLLQLRNYLFSRQAQLLLLSAKPWEVARRTVGFLHNTIQELSILDVDEKGLEGSLDCWVLLTCLEVLRTCERHHDTAGPQVTQYCLYTADLWAYAAEKLLSLGRKCGLMPGQTPSSAQIHLVVNLTAGLQEDIYVEQGGNSTNPLERLKQSLSSNEALQKSYLEMCEIAISSYKTVGRIRSARLLGKHLATFYLSLGEVQKAASFLVEGLKTFQLEGWDMLAAATMLDLARCYKDMEDWEKYVRMCAQISSCGVLDEVKRIHFFNEMLSTLSLLESGNQEMGDILVHSDNILDFRSCQVDKSSVEHQLIPGTELNFSLVLHSCLPKPVSCSSLKVSLSHVLPPPAPTPPPTRGGPGDRRTVSATSSSTTPFSRRSVQRSPSTASSTTSTGRPAGSSDHQQEEEDEGGVGETMTTNALDIVEQLDYKQDKSLCAARLVCRNSTKVLKRKDSSGSILKDASQLLRADYSLCLTSQCEPLIIQPGTHTYKVTGHAGPEGRYIMTQMSVTLSPWLDFLQSPALGQHQFTVMSEPPVVLLNRFGNSDLYAGLENKMVVSLFTGSRALEAGSQVSLSCSRGMLVRTEEEGANYSTKTLVTLPAASPFETVSATILVKAVLTNQKDSGSIEHRVTITDPWALSEKEVVVHFVPAFYTTFNLQTALSRKFLQILVFPLLSEGGLSLSGHKLTFVDGGDGPDLRLRCLNAEDDVLDVNSQCEAGYLWELILPEGGDRGVADKSVKVKFSVKYLAEEYEVFFQFQDFLTLYTIQARVDPAKGNEFCRAGTMCPMTVQLEQFNVSAYAGSLFYEILADQATWAVCGRQGAVVETDRVKQHIVVEVMPLLGGHLPLPTVRLSKYIPADSGKGGGAGLGGARLDPFSIGQVYNMSRSQQIHVLPPLTQHNQEFVSLP